METIGVDLGGTKMLIGVVSEGSVTYERVAPSIGLSQEELVAGLIRELEAARAAHPEVGAAGLGVPCTIDRERGLAISAVNLPIHDLPLRELVTERTGMAVSVDNDANAAMLAEHRIGAATGARNAVLATIGTGIGGGLVVDGEIYRGTVGAGAELGHTVIDHDGPPCQGNCPNRGCVEVLASGTALGKLGAEVGAREPESALGRVLAEEGAVEGADVTGAARAGDSRAQAAVGEIGRRLGTAMSSWANIFNPDVIVLGGGVVAGAGELLLDPARDELARRALPPMDATPVVAAALGARGGMIGAAILAAEEVGQ